MSAYAGVFVPTVADQQIVGCQSIQAADIRVSAPGSATAVLLRPTSGGLDRASLLYCNTGAGPGRTFPATSS